MARRIRSRADRTVPVVTSGIAPNAPRVLSAFDIAAPGRSIRLATGGAAGGHAAPDTATPVSQMPPAVQQMLCGDETAVYDTLQAVLFGHNGRLQIETDSDVDLDILTLLRQRGSAA
jgi:hypothetical protein